MTYTVGSYLAARLVQIGLKHHFAVAGDFTISRLLVISRLSRAQSRDLSAESSPMSRAIPKRFKRPSPPQPTFYAARKSRWF
jgi:hypothetical protein